MSSMEISRDELRSVLEANATDGWLIFDFHGVNPVAKRVLGYQGMVTRRVFAWFPQSGTPTLIVHSIDAGAIAGFPGDVQRYTTWRELHQVLERLLSGKRVAMEVSPKDAVPYLDRVPAGVIELLDSIGVSVRPSAELVTRFASRWSERELQDHRGAAEALAEIARETLSAVVSQAGSAVEYEVQQEVLQRITDAGLRTDDPPIVAFGSNAANPHYGPDPNNDRTLRENEVVLLDLWGRVPGSAWADQTWMGFSGNAPPSDVVDVWESTRDARDAVVKRLESAFSNGEPITGAALDDIARGLLDERGYGEWFVHRTGHSIDADLHGSGPHLDNFETNDVRELVPGVGFSIEPGVYLPDRFGVRSEINVVLSESGPIVTPKTPQVDLICKS